MWVELEQDYKIGEIVKLEDQLEINKKKAETGKHNNKFEKAKVDHTDQVLSNLLRNEHFE